MADEQENIEQVDEEVIREATSMGWQPQDKFKGDPEKWVPADEYLERGRHVLPILQQNNKRLQNELLTRDKKLDTLSQQLAETRQQLERLDAHYSEANKRAVAQAKKELLVSLKEARENDDLEAEQAILSQLDDIRASEKETKPDKKEEKKSAAPAKPYTEELDADTRAFLADNDWYGVDKKRTKAYNRLAEDMRDDGVTTTGRAFMDEVLAKLEEQEQGEESGTPRQSKVESGNNRSSARAGSKSFAALPAEAKRACHDDADILVGPNKKYKTLKEWEDDYAKIYHTL